jgi:hypothetical protein
MQEACRKVGAFGVEYSLLVSFGNDVSEQRNLFGVEIFAYVFDNNKIIIVQASVAAYDAARQL